MTLVHILSEHVSKEFIKLIFFLNEENGKELKPMRI